MNPLPPEWRDAGANEIQAFVLVDGAMQHELGRALAKKTGQALSFFDRESPDAQALGPWLLQADIAMQAGVNGCAPGITWLRGTFSLQQAFSHLHPWIVQPLADGVKRGYLRLGDGRTLRALFDGIWKPPQRDAFLRPWTALCVSDRDGRALSLPLSTKSDHRHHVSPRLDKVQQQALLDASVPDQLLHELKRHVQPHPDFSSREQRHAMAAFVIDTTRSLGYDTPYDWMVWIGWSLKKGNTAQVAITEQSARMEGLHGQALWQALMDDADREMSIDAIQSYAASSQAG